MIIPGGISEPSLRVLTAVLVLLHLAAIFKFVQAIMGIGGGSGGNWFKGGKNDSDDKDDDPASENNTKKRKEKKTRADKIVDKVLKDHFDPYNPGLLKFLVVDEDDNPIQGATINIEPKYAKKKRNFVANKLNMGRDNKDTWRSYELRTNADGLAPAGDTYEKVGSGVVQLTVISKKNIFVRNHYYKPALEVIRDEKQFIIITMEGKGAKDELFEPFIHKIEIKNDELTLTGEVK